MPRRPSPLLRECLERANPQLRYVVEVSVPDAARVLRRPDALLASPDPLASVSPADGLVAGADGGVTLQSAPATLAAVLPDVATANTSIRAENLSVRHKGLQWTVARGFVRGRLSAVTASLRADVGSFGLPLLGSRIQLQVYRVTHVPGVRLGRRATGELTEQQQDDVTFTPLLSPPAVLTAGEVGWAGLGGTVYGAEARFPLENYRLELDDTAGQTGSSPYEENAYYFEVSPLDDTSGSTFQWRTAPGVDGTSPNGRTVAGVGTFRRTWWDKADGNAVTPWVRHDFDDCYCFRLEVAAFGAATTAVHRIDLGRAPSAGTTARVVFEREQPAGTACAAEVSTAGAGGPWAAVTHGDPLPAQGVYHLRTTLTPGPASRTAPTLRALGVEARQLVDVTAEAKLSLPSREVAVPWGAAGIGRGQLAVLRLGARDGFDVATRLGSTAPATRLEVDVYLAPRHPLATRDDYLRLERASVVDRTPTPTSETFDLASYSQKLKRQIPRKVESVATTHVVAAATTAYIKVSSATPLPAVTLGGAGFSMRIATSSSASLPAGTVLPIYGSRRIALSGPDDALDYLGHELAGVLAAGDTIEIHSGALSAGRLVYSDADVPDAWADVLDKALVPLERVGHGAFPRGGRPPSAAEVAPAAMGYTDDDRATLLVGNLFTDGTEAGEILDQLSALRGGFTTEVDGQLVWVQLYPVRGPDGRVTIPLPPVSRVIDARDYAGLATPPTLAGRTVVASGAYGVNKAAANPDATASKIVSWIDADALQFLDAPEFEFVGAASVPDEIAAWCYNTADQGKANASRLTRQMVVAGSTGLRVFSWTEPRAGAGGPLALPGDVVGILTDQYTDADPGSDAPADDGSAAPVAGGVSGDMRVRPIVGWTIIRGVLVSVSGDGRTFRALIPGLSEGVRLLGGNGGTQEGSTAPIPAPTDFRLTTQVVATRTGGSVSIAARFTAPTSVFFDHVEYVVERRAADPTDTAPYSGGTVVAGGRAGNDLIVADWQHDYRVTPVFIAAGGTRTVGAAATIRIADPPAATITLGTPVRESGRVRWPFTLGPATAFAEVWAQTSSTDPGPARSVEGVGQQLTDVNAGEGTTEIVVDLAGASDFAQLTAVPYGAFVGRGTPANAVAQGDASASPPAAPSGAANVGHTATSITNTVTPNAAGSLRVYRDGVAIGALIPVVASGSPQSITHTGLSPATAYEFSYEAVSAAGTASATRASAGAVTTDAATLVAPVISGGDYDVDLGGYFITVDNALGEPSDTTYSLKVGTVVRATSTTATLFRARAPGASSVATESVTVVASAPGYGTSSASNTVVVTIPRASG